MSERQTKTQVEFYVSRGEENLGPWSIDEVAVRLARAEIAVTDFIFDDAAGDWIPLMECAALKEKLRAAKPKAPPKPVAVETKSETKTEVKSEVVEAKPVQQPVQEQAPAARHKTVDPADVTEWFVQKGQHRFGPLTYRSIVQSLQEKAVYEFDFVWKEGMETWIRIAEHEAFKPECIRELLATAGAKSGEVFFRRRFPRFQFEGEVMVHDNRSVWTGRAAEASEGGFGLVINNATLIPGQVLMVHFASREGLPAFNATCEIVSKRFTKDIRDLESPVNYGVRILKLDATAEPQVMEYIRARAAERNA